MAIIFLGVATNYTGTANALPDCELDAHNWAKLLKPYVDSTTLVLGKKATRQGILEAGKKWLDTLETGDLGILLFSCHGSRERISGEWHEAIVCNDMQMIYDFETDEMLSDRWKNTWLSILGDLCFSGGMARGNPRIARTIPLSQCKPHKATPPSRPRAMPNVIYYAGCKETEYSYSTGKGGAMSLAMQKALAEGGLKATFGWLHKRVAGKRPKGLLPTDEWPQTPQVIASARNLRRTLGEFKRA